MPRISPKLQEALDLINCLLTASKGEEQDRCPWCIVHNGHEDDCDAERAAALLKKYGFADPRR